MKELDDIAYLAAHAAHTADLKKAKKTLQKLQLLIKSALVQIAVQEKKQR